jgi:hypothetical protein
MSTHGQRNRSSILIANPYNSFRPFVQTTSSISRRTANHQAADYYLNDSGELQYELPSVSINLALTRDSRWDYLLRKNGSWIPKKPW